MSRLFMALGLTAALAACDSENPFDQEPVVEDPETPVIEEGEEVSSEGIPLALADNLQSVAYVPGTGSDPGTLSVDMLALDRTDSDIPLQDYTPNAALTALAPGYEVFSYQDDALDRMFVAIVAQSNDGSVLGAVVMDGGQFTKFFGGGFYATDGDYTPGSGPNDTGLVSYAGTYAGLSNLNADGNELMTPPPGTDPALLPDQPAQITGDIFLNADFGDNQVNGAIYNRAFVNLDPALQALIGGNELEDVYLIPADITDEGTFFGTAENPAQEGIGSYGGTFGGTEAAGVAGVVHLDGDTIPGIENEDEFGVFVLTQCGQPGEDPVCAAVNPS
ncbi:thymidylate synthase [Thalassorhabdomicrobium marinisediminis]|uniref:thymidylate synthase n=1 Tax=Thalassorhabdomicrobium marinisediminis TaxID=2170577 RepID=UPI002491939B|nr:thymidylate synthase [Thalassorhabdomicrobium marinisediminis]